MELPKREENKKNILTSVDVSKPSCLYQGSNISFTACCLPIICVRAEQHPWPFLLIWAPFPLLQNCSDTAEASGLMPVTQVTLQWVSGSLLVDVEKASSNLVKGEQKQKDMKCCFPVLGPWLLRSPGRETSCTLLGCKHTARLV